MTTPYQEFKAQHHVCACGYWSCGTRGCGMCPDCYGEHCECFLLEDYEDEEDFELRAHTRSEEERLAEEAAH